MSKAEDGKTRRSSSSKKGGNAAGEGGKQQQRQRHPADGEDDMDMVGDDGDEDYVFDPVDFPMLEGDFFGSFDDDELDGASEGLVDDEVVGKGKKGEAGAAKGETTTPRRTAKLPVVAVIGRPNVGKSTIVNRLCKTMSTEPDAIVYDYEGVTRDRIYRT